VKIKSINVRLATEADQHLDAYDNTKLVAVNTCPTWGIVTYDLHKTFANNSRAMALEAGQAMHEVFAAVRLYQLVFHTLKDEPEEIKRVFLEYHGKRLFNTELLPDRFEAAMLPQLDSNEDERTKRLNFCLSAFYTCGYYDDPSDRRRTSANLEECAIVYIERYDFNRYDVLVQDRSNPEGRVGIEIAFDVVIEFTLDDGTIRDYRFIGKFDGLMTDPRSDNEVIVGENKTASRLDEPWEMSFEISSQVTGYMVAGSAWADNPITRAIVYGLQVPQPKSDINGSTTVPVKREDHQFEAWFSWFLHSVDTYERHRANVNEAPRYSHSCNRYFRSCSLIPFCSSDKETQDLMLEEMNTRVWNPLHEQQGTSE